MNDDYFPSELMPMPRLKIPMPEPQINLDKPTQVLYWLKRFGCTYEELAAAVQQAGRSADAVEHFLKANASVSS